VLVPGVEQDKISGDHAGRGGCIGGGSAGRCRALKRFGGASVQSRRGWSDKTTSI
jgi:hypothetical protein